jgi:DNA-binding ferritin-like protein (Dps family)
MPKIFQEMSKRRQKLDSDFQKAKSEGRDGVLSAKESLAGEVADLCDWLGRSEMGIWQNLPQDPTWGQLRRMSALWHEEQHAIELDRQARDKAKFAEEREAHKLNPFAPRGTEHWEPIVGIHKRDGWEAVELTSQAQLTEEGQAMHHCVSSYASTCREGHLRIFSIRLDGERKCTMEIRSDKDLRHLDDNASFRITQNKGKHNAEVVSPATRAFCDETIVAATHAWRVKYAETQELRRLDEEKKEAARQAAAAEHKAQADAEKALAATKDGAPASDSESSPHKPELSGATAKPKV